VKLKSYFSGTVEAAMELARQELGDEALLVNARPATPETRYLGAYEVVFGLPPKSERAPVERPALEAARIAAPETRATPDTRLADDVAELKRSFAQLMEALAAGNAVPAMEPPPRPAPSFSPQPSDLESQLRAHLEAQDLAPSLTQAIAGGTPFEDLFDVAPSLGRPGAARAIAAFVGPPGVGKTTTLVKLAARYGLAARKPVHILSTDVFRIAAADQLRSLAAILGIGCDVVETTGALAQLLEEHRSKEMIFIDTPGLTRTEMEDAEDLAQFLSNHAEVDTHLVLSASMRPADLARTIDRYSIFHPHKLLFTRIDETSQYGALISEAHRLSLPLSFLATGQQIPDDLEQAEKARLKELILGVTPIQIDQVQPHRKGASA
jgi:flagellar biosynthesis protein FlhF